MALEPGEAIRWIGAPSEAIRRKRELRGFGLRVFLIGLFAVCTRIAYRDMAEMPLGAPMFVFFCFLTGYVAYGALVRLRRWRRRGAVWYVATDRRGLAFDLNTQAPPERFPFDRIDAPVVRRHADGSGDVLFWRADVQVGDAGAREGVGFFGIDDPDRVAELVAGAARSQPSMNSPNSLSDDDAERRARQAVKPVLKYGEEIAWVEPAPAEANWVRRGEAIRCVSMRSAVGLLSFFCLWFVLDGSEGGGAIWFGRFITAVVMFAVFAEIQTTRKRMRPFAGAIYAITDRRAFVYWPKDGYVDATPPFALADLACTERADGRYDVRFTSRALMHEPDEKSLKKRRFRPGGGLVYPFGFKGVRDGPGAERHLLRLAQQSL